MNPAPPILVLGPLPQDLGPGRIERGSWPELLAGGHAGPYAGIWADGLPDLLTPGELERRLVPGGLARIRVPRGHQARRIARRLRPWFEGAAPGPRYPAVRVTRLAGACEVAVRRRGPGHMASHFDHIAAEYRGEIPAHVVADYTQRKVAVLRAALPGGRILDLGCGIGTYADVLASSHDVVGVDASAPSLQEGAAPGLAGPGQWPRARVAGLATALPFADASFQGAYAINTLHHLKRGEQSAALAEVHRVLAPAGRLAVLEINVANPVFGFYMRRIFPRTRRIDRGDEEFLPLDAWQAVPGFALESVRGGTFLPDFVPRILLRPARALERALEATPLRRYGIHYTAILRKVEA